MLKESHQKGFFHTYIFLVDQLSGVMKSAACSTIGHEKWRRHQLLHCSWLTSESWKAAVVTPILKKGCKTDKANFRPVSCLPAASKVLEKVVCMQTTQFLEENNLLSRGQHGFRAKHSTMTAHEQMQTEWINNTEEGLMTGILIWDLSAAFDTIDIDLLVIKRSK